jgi:hypothetical protein
MWTPLDTFFIIWFCNFAPCQEARLNVCEIKQMKENKYLIESIVLRNDN